MANHKISESDLVGKRFGRLKVVGVDGNRSHHLICRCECGNEASVSKYSLTHGWTRSCGCLRRETSSETGESVISRNNAFLLEMNRKYNTNFARIINPEPGARNTSGKKGVSFVRRRGLWTARISVHGKSRFLGYYNTFEEAAQARSNAEDRYFSPLIAAWSQENARRALR